MINLKAKCTVQSVVLMTLVLAAGLVRAQSNTSLVPIVSYVLDQPLTDRSNIQCTLELISISPSAGSSIPVNSTFSATFSYRLSQRPLDVEVRINSLVLEAPNNGSQRSLALGSDSQRFIVGIDQGAESMIGQFTVSSFNGGLNAVSELRDLTAGCIFYTLHDEMDAQSDPAPLLGSRVQFSSAGAPINSTQVNWILEAAGLQ